MVFVTRSLFCCLVKASTCLVEFQTYNNPTSCSYYAREVAIYADTSLEIDSTKQRKQLKNINMRDTEPVCGGAF